MSAAATTSASADLTLGMRLDALLESVDNLSSTQLYGLIVAATVALCVVLLGTGSSPEGEASQAAWNSTDSPKAARPATTGKQPRWYIFRYVNATMIFLFLGSVVLFGSNASFYMEISTRLSTFLGFWSVFLCYFCGFFGVSFIYNEIPASEVNTKPTKTNTKANEGPSITNKPSSSSATAATSLPSKKMVHPPAASTPVCSDPSSLKAAPSSGLPSNLKELPDEEIAQMVLSNRLKDHLLEKKLDPFRAVDVRRLAASTKLRSALGASTDSEDPLANLPSQPSLDYGKVHGANCEIVVGYVPLPVGLVGPLTLNGESVYIPMATTEGCLVASTNRGAKAICQGGGAQACILRDGITRAPCVRMASAMEAADLKLWCEQPENFVQLKRAFESTTSFGKLKACNPTVAGRNVYLRLVCFSGDAMGMNMVSKGSLAVIELLQSKFESLQLVALSGNMCTDKKAAATNWLEGRGKSVVVEVTVPQSVVRSTLKTSVQALVHTNLHKNLIGSAMAGSLGGFNAHASNIVTAIFLATGQDPAQNVESSNCITLMEETPEGDLWMSCTMPSIEVGTVGGGTSLAAQAACLTSMGCKGGGSIPGENARKLATVVAAATMAGELSLLAALAANTLVQAHMTHNRKPASK